MWRAYKPSDTGRTEPDRVRPTRIWTGKITSPIHEVDVGIEYGVVWAIVAVALILLIIVLGLRHEQKHMRRRRR